MPSKGIQTETLIGIGGKEVCAHRKDIFTPKNIMNLYTIVTNDQYELPIQCDIRVKEVAEFLGTTTNNVRNMVVKPRKKSKYKVIISGKYEYDKKAYLKRYAMTHDRSEYHKNYYQIRKKTIENSMN